MNKATLLKNNDLKAIIRVFHYASEKQTAGRMIELMENGSLNLTDATRSGRRVCLLEKSDHTVGVYCDNFDVLTAEQLASDIL